MATKAAEETKTYTVWVSTNKMHSRCETTITLPADFTTEEVEDACRDAMWNMINWSFKEET